MVVFHHARWFFPATSVLFTAAWGEVGSRGVDIFFVISGYVMTVSTRNFSTAIERRLPQAADFIVKRFIRVVPLYWIATLWAARRFIWSGAAGWPLVEDFLFVPHFSEGDHGLIWPYLFQGWTINYELFFYALFAISMLAGRRRFLCLSLALLALILLGTAANIAGRQPHVAATIFYTSNLLFEFLMGVWLALWMRGRKAHLPAWAAAIVTVLGFVALALPNDDTVRGFADGMVAVVIVWATLQWSARVELPWLGRLGDASYSIYLFHMTIYGASLWLFGALGLLQPTRLDMLAVVVLQLVFASALGLGLHLALEKPLLRWLRSRAVVRAWRSRPH